MDRQALSGTDGSFLAGQPLRVALVFLGRGRSRRFRSQGSADRPGTWPYRLRHIQCLTHLGFDSIYDSNHNRLLF